MFDNEDSLEKLSLKFTNPSKDYDISKIQYTFDFIFLVLKRDSSIDDAIKGVARDYNISENDLRIYLLENKYILNSSNKNSSLEQLNKYNTKSLKKILKKHGLKTSGKRDRIEQRILENNLLGNDYHLSSKSKVFYKNKKRRIYIFNKYLIDYYYFNEFNEFYMDNYRKKQDKIPVEFIKLHINKSFEDKNHKNYIFNSQVMAQHYLKKENYTRMLEYVLRSYCINLNPIWKIDELKGHVGLLEDTYENLKFIRDKLSKNAIINTYYLVWDSFNFDRVIVPKYEGYRYLKAVLNDKNYNRINEDLDNRFYMNEDLKIKKITQKTLFDF